MNVILIILDTLRKDHVGCYGNKWIKTPNLDRLEKESIIFDNAYPETLPTIPVRRAIHTGIRCFPFKTYNPHKGDYVKSFGWEPIPEDQDTLAEILRKKPYKYKPALITDTYHLFKPSMNFHRGFSEWQWIRGQENDPYKSAPEIEEKDLKKYFPKSGISINIMLVLRQYLKNNAFRKSEKDYLAPRVFSAAINWLEENQKGKNFFLCIDSFDPHEPWDPPQKYRDLYFPDYNGQEIIQPNYATNINYLTPDELKYMRACYAGEVTMVDTWLGKFMDKVKELDLLDNSLIICISDHGHQLGEHNMTGKIPWGLYPELLDIPLFIRHPEGVGKGKHIKSFVYNHDILPTILAQLKIHPRNPVDGKNLWPLLDDDFLEDRSYVTCGFNSYIWIRDKNYAYITDYKRKREELYDLRSDSEQLKNIAENNQDIKQDLFKRILLDADGVLIDHSTQRMKKVEEWYRMS